MCPTAKPTQRTQRRLSFRATALQWPKRPRRHLHPTLGRRQRWLTAFGDYLIERFPDATGEYMALARLEGFQYTVKLISRHRTLAAAKRACQRHARNCRPLTPDPWLLP